MDKIKVILDVDTGSDDAIAIMTALRSPELDVLGIMTVNGNKPVENTTENTLRVLDLMGQGEKIPVYKGCQEPLVAGLLKTRSMNVTKDIVEKDGKIITYHHPYLEELLPSRTKPEKERAITWLIRTLMESDGDITLIAVGPLTNLAVAMRANPEIVEKIKKIIIMGGGCLQTNTTSASEFNIHMDPEAAQIVLTSGCEIVLVPLDATHRAWVTREESRRFREIGSPVSVAVADLLDTRIEAYDELQPIAIAPQASTPPHDALAVCAAIDEAVLQDVQFRRVDVDFGGGIADGMTVVDPRVRTDQPKNVSIAFGADREKFVNMLFERLGY